MRFRKNKAKFHIFVLILLVVPIAATYLFDVFALPHIKAAAKSTARSLSTYIINDAVCDILERENVSYGNIVDFEKEISGKIAALKTDTVRLNRLKSAISIDIYHRLKNEYEQKFGIPLGTVTGGVFYGYGPEIPVKLRQTGAVVSEFRNEFASAGINQTCHRIMIDITVSFSVMLPFSQMHEKVTASVCAAESVIIGEVPEAFTNVQNGADTDDETVADEIVDFGAQNFLG
ncbi:MAG: sporulation protein YunB [Clostridia bacterium]|nr:sporulation protein YunB [Clostridia bacterium]